MQALLAKYIHKNYYEFLKNDKINLDLARLGWVKPAIIPKQTILYDNRLIRKYLTRTLNELYHDLEFQRILCRVGYYGPACTTTSTTTTSTTTVIPGALISNSTIGDLIFGATFNGVTPPWVHIPISNGQSQTGALTAGTYTFVAFTLSATPPTRITVTDSNGAVQCQNVPSGNTYTFPNVVVNSSAEVIILFQQGTC
jgi:hypothetical protein